MSLYLYQSTLRFFFLFPIKTWPWYSLSSFIFMKNGSFFISILKYKNFFKIKTGTCLGYTCSITICQKRHWYFIVLLLDAVCIFVMTDPYDHNDNHDDGERNGHSDNYQKCRNICIQNNHKQKLCSQIKFTNC